MKLSFGILVLLPLLVLGQQNLVSNGGFEEYTVCPWTIGQLELATGWINTGGGGTPDLFNECAISGQSVGVPINTPGNQYAHSQFGYAGFYALSDVLTYPNMREYLQTELIEPLGASTTYEVILHLSLAERSKYAISGIGIHFSDTIVERENGIVLDLEPQIKSPEWTILNDKVGWVEIRDTFYSRFGGERWMIIGNFQYDSLSQITYVDSIENTLNRSYYYIDDVSVIALDSMPNGVEEVSDEANGFSVYPNPNNGRMMVNYHISDGETATLVIYNMIGELVFERSLNSSSNLMEIDVANISSGVYMLDIQVNGEHKLTERLSILKERNYKLVGSSWFYCVFNQRFKHVVIVPIVVFEHELSNIIRKIFRTYLMILPCNASFNDCPKGFNRIRIDSLV